MDSNTTNSNETQATTFETLDFEELTSRIELETAPQTPIGLGSARFLSLTGWALFGGGLALTFGATLSWKVAQAAELVTGFGFQTGTIVVGGLALMGMGRVGRSLARFAQRPRLTDMGMVEAVEMVTDQVATLTENLSALGDRVTVLALRESNVTVSAPAPDEDLIQLYRDQKDATFQLAAGLDKLNRRVGDDLATQVRTLDTSLRELETTLSEELSTKLESSEEKWAEALRNELATMHASLRETRNEEVAELTPIEEPASAEDVAVRVSNNTTNEPQAVQPEPTIDVELFEPERETEANAEPTSAPVTEFADLSETVASGLSGFADTIHSENEGAEIEKALELEDPHPQIQPEVSPLAFLEGLKSIEPASQNPHAPNVSAPPLDFDSLGGPPAALPRQRTPENQHSPENERTNQ